MTILNPDHLFEQAERLIGRPSSGPTRQVDIRRAISAAYYGLFHATLAGAADLFVGVTKRSSNLYALAYRSVDHGSFRDLCFEARKTQLPQKYRQYVTAGAFGANIQDFAGAAIDLQEKRHSADYDPSIRVKISDAILAIKTARDALVRFNAADSDQREAFLGLLLFRPR